MSLAPAPTLLPGALLATGAAPSGLLPLDWLVIIAYAVGLLVIGYACSRRNRSSDDYLLGGRRMGSFGIGLSMFATLISTLSYLGTPGEMIANGPGYLAYMAALPIIFVVVGYGLIPFLMRLPVTSAYEILETRLGPNIRLAGTTIFLLTRFAWMALVIYMTASKVIVVVLGWGQEATPYVCAAIGLLTVAYTAMGGIRAVVTADVIQSFILLGGAIAALIVITVRLGSIDAWWPTTWDPSWQSQPLFSLDPHVRITIVGIFIHNTLFWVFTAGSDQMMIQRYLATRDAPAARRAFLYNNIAETVVTLVLAMLGFALLAYYRAQPAAGIGADSYFPQFIVSGLPAGLSGLIIAGLLAAAMSSLSSGINSSATVIVVDFVRRFGRRRDQQEEMRLSRAMSAVVGALAVAVSLVVGWVPGNIVDVTNKTNNLFLPPMFGLFFMALFVRFATPLGAGCGAVTGLATAFLVAYWDLLTGSEPVTFTWIFPLAFAAHLAVGCLVSLVTPAKRTANGKTPVGAFEVQTLPDSGS